jgi:soluble lytic murein transglycosylase-like protein
MLGRYALTFKTGPLTGRTFSLGPGECLYIGSGPSCAIRLEDDPTVETVHACVYYDKTGRIRLKDMGGEHGTARNGRKVKGETRLRAGDRVTVGRLSTFHSSWWNALQSSRMTRMSRFVTKRIAAGERDSGQRPKARMVAALLGAALVLGGGGFLVWRLASGELGATTRALAAKALPRVATLRKRAPSDMPRGRASALTADRRFIWDEIVSISRRFGDPPPSAMDLGFVKEVEKSIQAFTTRRRYEPVLERKAKYWGTISKLLRSRGLPEEVGYVCWVESGYDPDAESPVGAAGLWQLMPETARQYGLTVEPGRDERRDPQRSTIAAAAYITDLLRMFKSKRYLLVLASYNTGQYRVLRNQLAAAIGDMPSPDFWQIRGSLPQETGRYVPQVMAAMIVGRNVSRWSGER